MGMPACLWRRTGEIYKGNKEFAALVNVPLEMLREVSPIISESAIFVNEDDSNSCFLFQGRLCIYELMAEESAVNYWEVMRRLLVVNA